MPNLSALAKSGSVMTAILIVVFFVYILLCFCNGGFVDRVKMLVLNGLNKPDAVKIGLLAGIGILTALSLGFVGSVATNA